MTTQPSRAQQRAIRALIAADKLENCRRAIADYESNRDAIKAWLCALDAEKSPNQE
jgi:hypothetical protein